MYKEQVYCALQQKARAATPAELTDLLNNFGGDERAVEAITAGVHATRGYADAHWKETLLIDFLTASGAFKNSKQAVSIDRDPTQVTLAEVMEELKKLSGRMDRLEAGNPGPKPAP